MKRTLLFVLLACAPSCMAGTATLCNSEGTCREVETGPIVKDFQQDVNATPPKDIIKHRVTDWKFWTANGVSIGSSIAATYSLVKCREDHGIGPCTDGGYGEFKTREGLRQGLTGGIVLLSFKIKSIEDENNDRYKFWWLLPVGNAAFNSSIIITNASKHYGPKELQ